ncbi:hypothetical protein AVEN_41256-1 [Araneus ventricosus]|uniref:Uncharacterized protein n=1 Tax=Araneus ventricosus TaxID=182803 RepID=A0A4Y2UMR3_ARAVE|nr:hypothetical protein AVEN_41256-1 [Araneus ventricosus]
MEILEQWKEKIIVKVENLWNLEEKILSGGIPNNSNSNTSSGDSLVGPLARVVGTSKDLTRLGHRDEATFMENPLTRRGHDLGNSIRDETWHISSIPLGCSPINLKKCNVQSIRRKWPSNFEHNLYTSNSPQAISALIA